MVRHVRPLIILACMAGIYLSYTLLPGNSIAADTFRAGTATLITVVGLIALTRLSAGSIGKKTSQERLRFIHLVVILTLIASIASSTVLVVQSTSQTGAPLTVTVLPYIAIIAFSCLMTAVWEEGIFRVMLPDLLVGGLQDTRHPTLLACIASALIFAVLHTGTTSAAGMASIALRGLQTLCFALTMSFICLGKGGLFRAIAVHAIYDIIVFAVPLAVGVSWPNSPALGTAELSWQTLLALPSADIYATATIPSIIASLVLLVPAAVISCMLLWKETGTDIHS